MAIKVNNTRPHSYIIFGGTKGIGRIISDAVVRRTSNVTVVSRTRADLAKQKSLYNKLGYKLNTSIADVRDEKQVGSVFSSHKRFFGSAADVIINCAAIQGPIGNAWDISAGRFRDTIDINLTGSFNVAKAAVRSLLKVEHGAIIFFSGGGAAYGRPRFASYAASKSALIRLVETIALELDENKMRNITINAIAPGAVSTNMTDEILKAGLKAGTKALQEAKQVKRSGGTSCETLLKLIDFLSDKRISGRLIHVRENYKDRLPGKAIADDAGKLRIVPFAK
jgi:3-oxoacyl-[acyl-carrier protein] reductase